MNFLFILLTILLIGSIYYLLLVNKRTTVSEPIRTPVPFLTPVQAPVPAPVPSPVPSRIKYSRPQPILRNHKWSGVQRNPVCCRIDHMNQNFYDFDIYP